MLDQKVIVGIVIVVIVVILLLFIFDYHCFAALISILAIISGICYLGSNKRESESLFSNEQMRAHMRAHDMMHSSNDNMYSSNDNMHSSYENMSSSIGGDFIE